MPRLLTRQMWRSFFSLPGQWIWKNRGPCALYYELLRSQGKSQEFARNTMADDLKRMEYTPGNYYNFHPGKPCRTGGKQEFKRSRRFNEVLTEEQTTTVLLETMAGKGSEVGRSFEELHAILELVKKDHKMGNLSGHLSCVGRRL